jgi:type I restriction enzyme, S subunit
MTVGAEIPKGYKLTEVGVIPEDWAVKSLDAMAFVTSGKRLPLGRSLTDHETPHPYIRVTDMRHGTVSLGDIKFVPRDAFPAIKRYRIFTDDIFISVAGTLGIVGKIPQELDGANLTENADRITNIACSRDYLLHVLMSPLTQNTIESLQTIGAQPKLALTRIRKFEIPLPPTKAEQEAVAEALSDADALIESLEQILAKKRQIKQGAMQELLTGKKRLPGFSGGWDVTTFGDLLRHHSGNSALIKGKLSNLPLAGYFDAYSASGQDVWHHGFENEGYALIVSAVGSRCGKTFKAHGKWSAIANTHVVWPDHCKVDAGFLFLFLNNEDFWLKSGSGQPFVLFKQSFAQELRIPPVTEQTAIATVLSDMDAEIAALEVKLAKARSLKQGMMQELLTGRIRLRAAARL